MMNFGYYRLFTIFFPFQEGIYIYISHDVLQGWIDNKLALTGLHVFGLGKPAPLEIKPLPEWEEPCTPVRSPVTRSFARE